jgi:hypothetical protein
MSDIVTFVPWADPVIDPQDQDPNGDFSRLAWLPIIGPTAWLIWGTISAQLRRDVEVTWRLEDLATAHGLGTGISKNAPVRRALTRLTVFGLIGPTDAEHRVYAVRLTAPQLRRRHLRNLPEWVAELQRQTYSAPGESAG